MRLVIVHLICKVQPEEGEELAVALDKAAQHLHTFPAVETVMVGAAHRLASEISVEMAVADDAVASPIVEQVRVKALGAPQIRRASVYRVLGGQQLYERVCRVGGETFYARKPDTDVCRGHWYAEAMGDAQRQYQPLIDQIKAATGLDSWVWQSGGMTMTLVTASGDPDKGDRYLTLVEAWHEDGRLEGSTGFYPDGSGNDEGENVLQAYEGGDDKLSEGVGFARPIPFQLWAELIANHHRSRTGR